MLDDATRARLEPLVETLAFLVGNSAALDLKSLLTAYDALHATQAQAAPVLDDVMTTLDWVSTATEGTPKQPFLDIHRRVGEQMRRINAWRAARDG